MVYYELVKYAFRRFSVIRGLVTAPATGWYYLRRPVLGPSEKPALFTMNILPPMMTVWHHLVKKHLKEKVDTVIFDCSGALDASLFPGARVQKFLNLYAATKSDEFLYSIAKHRKIGWICDDDIFLLSGESVDRIEREFRDPKTATVSFRSRTWWHFEIDGKRYEPSGSYCTAFSREILCNREHLSLRPADGNMHPSHIGKPVARYDTGDKANEIMLQRGYRCAVIPEAEQDRFITGFSGVSSAVMLLWYFKTPEETMKFLLTPPETQWSGNTLFTLLCGFLAISTIQELHHEITGKTYPLRSLPPRHELEKIRREHEHLLRNDQNFENVDRVSETLRKAV